MGNCYSINRIAEDHIHTNITGNIQEPQQKCRLGPVSNGLLGRGGGRAQTCFTGSKPTFLPEFHMTDLDILNHSIKRKPRFHNRINRLDFVDFYT